MNTQATALRELAVTLLRADELAMALLRQPDVECEGMLMRISRDAAADADELLFMANQMDPPVVVPTLFQWAEGKERRVVL